MAETINYRFVVKRDTAANFTSKDTLLLSGEYGLETDTRRIKMGDGVTAWTSLPYYTGNVEAFIHATSTISSPSSSDEIPVLDSANSFGMKKITWAGLKAALKTYFDTIYTGGGGGGSSAYSYADPAFSSVSMLHHYEGTNGSTTITDQVSGNVWTASGGAAISTAWFAKGASSLKLAASGNSCVSMPTNSKYNVGNGDWTIQFTYNYIGSPQTSARVFQTKDGDVYAGIGVTLNTSGGPTDLRLYLSSNGTAFDVLNGPLLATLSTTSQSEVLIQRIGANLYCAINGFVVWTGSVLNNNVLYYNSADTVIIGGNKTGTSRSINAYLDEFRFTKGIGLLIPNRAYPVQPAFPDS